MSIDMYVSASKNQAKSVSDMTKQQIMGYEELQKAIADFTLNSPFLTGKAYDTSKAFFSTVLYPLAQGGILLSEAVDRAVTKFPEDYQSQVDSGNLKQSDLEEKIRQAEGLIGQAEGIRTMLESSLTPDIIKTSQLAANLRLLESYSGVKRILEEKLDKLMTFNHNSPKIFEEIQALEDAIDQGLAQTTTAFNPDTGTFMIPSKEALSWSKTINEKWADYEARHTAEDKVEVKKTQLPGAEIVYMVYRNGELDKEATSELAKEIAKADLKSMNAFLAGAGYQVLENNGVKALLDFVFGERELEDSVKQHKGYNEGVFTGNLLSLLQSGAEFIGGGLWLLGGTSGSLALAPATGGSSVSAIPAISGSTLAIWTHAAAIGGMSIQNIMSGNGYHLPNAKIGANGTQVSSKTTWKNGKTERVDVENPAPGIRDGDIHYHDSNNTKWRYDIKNNEFINPKTGELAPQKIQKLLKNKDILKGIQKALEVLGK
ncbi:T7SS effector LXG polymorphic toxin [Carnobacterium gallinarum]|uniref:T7SS effector LXG polymorphic toxin n=1 Tax=Carnobacterium gallinarum TaxID=2749 RepID=UPI00068B7197|nr:T7SS effector LXG polymorphic toxin [Carnobacterium gallinarum]